MIVLRQKSFAEGEEKKGLSKGAKVALGAAATTALAFAGARRGMLGGKAQVATNTMWGNAGKTFGSAGMIKSASTGIKKGVATQAISSGANARDAIKAGQFAANNAAATWNTGNRLGVRDAVNDSSLLANITGLAGAARGNNVKAITAGK